jgi:DNA-binding NarL/FixJ family response regulator
MVEPGEYPQSGELRWAHSLGRLVTLTEREFQVFMLLGHGLSNRRIGAALHIGERTVKLHVSNILRKLALESRLQAGLAAAEHALTSTWLT